MIWLTVIFLVSMLASSLPVFLIYYFTHGYLKRREFELSFPTATYLVTFETLFFVYWVILLALPISREGEFPFIVVAGPGVAVILFLLAISGLIIGSKPRVFGKMDKLLMGANVFYLLVALSGVLIVF